MHDFTKGEKCVTSKVWVYFSSFYLTSLIIISATTLNFFYYCDTTFSEQLLIIYPFWKVTNGCKYKILKPPLLIFCAILRTHSWHKLEEMKTSSKSHRFRTRYQTISWKNPLPLAVAHNQNRASSRYMEVCDCLTNCRMIPNPLSLVQGKHC